jgi:hypothetical protein
MRGSWFGVAVLSVLVATFTPSAAEAAWQKMSPVTTPDGGCGGLKFFTDTQGLSFCGGKVMSTTDGTTWGATGVGVPQVMLFLSPTKVTFLSPTVWLAHGDAFDVSMSVVGRTTDGGTTWTKVPVAGGAKGSGAVKLDFHDAQNGLAYGIGGMKAFVAVTKDGGATFTDVALPFLPAAADAITRTLTAAMIDPMKWVVVVAGGTAAASMTYVEYTTDGGATWKAATGGVAGGGSAVGFVLLQAIDATHVVGLSPTGTTTRGLWTSADGGATWTKIDPGPDAVMNPNFNSMLWKDAMNGLLGGDGGKILRTSDGGKTWALDTVPADWDAISAPLVGGFAWPGPSAYAYPASNNKIILRDPAAGGASPVGTAGATGAAGTTGAAGATSTAGTTGAAGATAAAGATGAAGTTGAAGATGAAGSGGKAGGGGGGGGCAVASQASTSGLVALLALSWLARAARRRPRR